MKDLQPAFVTIEEVPEFISFKGRRQQEQQQGHAKGKGKARKARAGSGSQPGRQQRVAKGKAKGRDQRSVSDADEDEEEQEDGQEGGGVSVDGSSGGDDGDSDEEHVVARDEDAKEGLNKDDLCCAPVLQVGPQRLHTHTACCRRCCCMTTTGGPVPAWLHCACVLGVVAPPGNMTSGQQVQQAREVPHRSLQHEGLQTTSTPGHQAARSSHHADT